MSKKAVKTLPCNCPIHKGKRLPVEKFSVNRSNKNRGPFTTWIVIIAQKINLILLE